MSVLRRVILVLLAGTLAVYLLILGLLYGAQESLMFPAPRVEVDRLSALARRLGAEEVRVRTDDGVSLYAWHRVAPATRRRVVLYFHGNAEVVTSSEALQQTLLEHGWDVFVMAYRGYPGSGGSPSEAGLTADAQAAWRHLTHGLNYEASQIVIHGRSLGGGVAGTLMTQVQPAGLVLESTFTSAKDLTSEVYWMFPVRWLLRHPFETRLGAAKVRYPVHIFHGDADQVIDVKHGRMLAGLFADATYREAEGWGHNDGLLPHDPSSRLAYLTFLERCSRAHQGQ